MKIFSTQDFLDFKVLGKSIIRNRNRDMHGNTVQWLKIKLMRFIKDTPDTIHFRYGFDDELPVNLYSPAITKAKYEDLLFLCNSLAIPKFYHDFYWGLKPDGNVRDAMAEPDATEDDEIVE